MGRVDGWEDEKGLLVGMRRREDGFVDVETSGSRLL